MLKNLRQQRNHAFLVALLIGSCYFFMLATAVIKIFPGFIMQIVFLGEFFQNPQINIFRLILSSNFIINISAGLILFFLLWVALRSLIQSLIVFFKTRKYLSSLAIVKRTKKLIVFQSKHIHAFTAGFFKPKAYVSSQVYEKLGKAKVKAIIFHELEHKRNFDPLKSFIVNIFDWSIPGFSIKKKFFLEYLTLVELSCDFFAEKRLVSKRPIIEALTDFAAVNRKTPLLVPNPSFVNGFSIHSTDRIEIFTGHRQLKARNLYLPALILLGFISFNTIFINGSKLFLKCDHVAECVRFLFDKTIQIVPEKHQQNCLLTNGKYLL